MSEATIKGHGGAQAVEVARGYGVQTMFTLSGAHVFPLYDGAVKADPPMRLVDVRHEQTAVFAAEATAKLTRTPGLAVLTAGPGVTNGISGVTTAYLNGSPLLVVGGRAPSARWGSGSLQELDHPQLVRSVTKAASTVQEPARMAAAVDEALMLATTPHRGPVFLDVPMDVLFSQSDVARPPEPDRPPVAPDPGDLETIGRLLAEAERPVLVVSSDVWHDRAEAAAVRLAQALRLPVVTNGMGRGILPRGHDLLVTRARSRAFGGADLVLVAGAPLDFRLGFGAFGGRDGNPPAKVVHLADSAGGIATHCPLAGHAAGDLTLVLDGVAAAASAAAGGARWADWLTGLQADARKAEDADEAVLRSDATPIHPARIYGDLLPLLDDDAVVIGDGGDFVSYAGKFVEPSQPGCWLDPGPYGCLGTGLGYAIAARLARPQSQVVLLLGDGAAGFSLMDVDTLVRHNLPVVMVVGNNSIWGLEKHPMQFLYGYDVAAELAPRTRYDEVVRALGGAGEMVTEPDGIEAALRRGFDAGTPYLVNVMTDPAVAYPRSTTGV